MESTIHCRSTPFLSLNPMFSVLPLPILAAPYLISTDTAQVFKNRNNLIHTSASVVPKYLNPFHLFLPLCRRFLRVFTEGMPLALPFNVDILSRNERISEVCHLPDDITIKPLNGSLTTYTLFGVTYGNGNHFKSGMCLPSPRVPQAGWYEYDGLWEHHQRGSGLRYCVIAKKPATPFSYFLSYALY